MGEQLLIKSKKPFWDIAALKSMQNLPYIKQWGQQSCNGKLAVA